ncbi:multidrug efflux RND transporter permease subunit [Methylosinus sporium]|uniref:Efflux pump membrane transporter n=1 Tax=Methylosinus sporium TaxID=428 RepID=A0A549SXL5_METSR|nr:MULTISPECIES: multidrug efflux RND transporter permease subunit [Methylosinus]MBU3890417.1 multidrug efflux RND transporter permease subunit [Methylosinus sp. KRF6]TRL34337.1 multidrug efflux RND transporter permease subunit [Methylosinus sporium]
MRFPHVFIERPILAIVVSLFITILGSIAYAELPIAQYPEIAPPTIQVTATYPGASAEVVSKTVATPLEQQINGVENMLYLSSQSTGDGNLVITVTFRLGADLDKAQVLTQNRVAIALPRLPLVVQRLGVAVKKSSPNLMMAISLLSPDGSRDQLYMASYATLNLRDALSRLEGVGDAVVFGNHDYAMRVWIDPDKAAARNLTAGEIVAALQAQNTQVSAGVLNQPPAPSPGAFQLNIKTLGRLTEPRQFADILLKSDPLGRVTRLRDVGRVEIGDQNFGANGWLDGRSDVLILIYLQPGGNALAMAERVKSTMREMALQFPAGLSYRISYDLTTFIAQSVRESMRTVPEAIVIVVVVVVLFLQTWRASIVPIIAVPISLVGGCIALSAFGMTLNNLSLFGIVLAVGIVVDDAIVVVENVERNLHDGLSPREAAHRTMDEIGGALVAIALTLCAVFAPSAFISGISGQFFRQFAVTIAASTLISAFVSLTLCPALCALLFRPAERDEGRAARREPITVFFELFNTLFEWLSRAYGRIVRRLLQAAPALLAAYTGLIALTAFQLARAPTGFIPDQDLGYFIGVVTLPSGASVSRTDAVIREAAARLEHVSGVANTNAFAGFDAATFTNASNAGTIFVNMASFEERARNGETAALMFDRISKALAGIQEASIILISPAPVPGLGTAGGFRMMLEDRKGLGPRALEAAAQDLVAHAMLRPGLTQLFTSFTTSTPSIDADVDRERAQKLGVAPELVFEAMQIYLGSAYINDFNYLGRTYQVMAQADGRFRKTMDDISRLRTRNASGDMVPLGALVKLRQTSEPYRVPRYNLYPAAEIQGGIAPGFASSYGLEAMERLAAERLPPGIGFEWTDLSYQQKTAGNTTLPIFGAAILLVFLVLAAQYESWRLPLAVVLIVPMCLLAAVTGLLLRSMNVDILAQIGFTVLVGLAAKNAILIVEFARRAEEQGATSAEAVVQAARLRLRPILMTSMAFILGVVPLLLAAGAGAEMRQTLGTTVFFGMLGVTFFGLVFTPVFYVTAQRLFRGR